MSCSPRDCLRLALILALSAAGCEGTSSQTYVDGGGTDAPNKTDSLRYSDARGTTFENTIVA